MEFGSISALVDFNSSWCVYVCVWVCMLCCVVLPVCPLPAGAVSGSWTEPTSRSAPWNNSTQVLAHANVSSCKLRRFPAAASRALSRQVSSSQVKQLRPMKRFKHDTRKHLPGQNLQVLQRGQQPLFRWFLCRRRHGRLTSLLRKTGSDVGLIFFFEFFLRQLPSWVSHHCHLQVTLNLYRYIYSVLTYLYFTRVFSTASQREILYFLLHYMYLIT